MKIIPYQEKSDSTAIAVAIGKFETLHPGHMKLIEAVVEAGQALSITPAVLSIEHPGEPGVLSFDEREGLLSESGIRLHLTCAFDEHFMNLSAEAFVRDVLLSNLSVKHVVVGHDFRFGHQRTGDVALLERLSDELGFGLTVIPEQTYDGKKLSSSGIREALSNGDVTLVEDMMGRPYCLSGTVVTGKRLGRTLGFPTANLNTDGNKILPAHGVYITKVRVDERTYYGLTNVGSNPTVQAGNTIFVETHLIDFSGDLYGKKITLSFVERVRGERKFASTYELKNQMESDRMYLVTKFTHQ